MNLEPGVGNHLLSDDERVIRVPHHSNIRDVHRAFPPSQPELRLGVPGYRDSVLIQGWGSSPATLTDRLHLQN